MGRKITVANPLLHREGGQEHVSLWFNAQGMQNTKAAGKLLTAAVNSMGTLAGRPIRAWDVKVWGDQSGPAAELPAALERPSSNFVRVNLELDPLPGQVAALKALVNPLTTVLHIPGYNGPPIRLRINRRNLVCLKSRGWPRGYTATQVAQVLLQDPHSPVEVVRVQQIQEGNLFKCGEFFLTAFWPDKHPRSEWDLVDGRGSLLSKIRVASVPVGAAGPALQEDPDFAWQWDSAVGTGAAAPVTARIISASSSNNRVGRGKGRSSRDGDLRGSTSRGGYRRSSASGECRTKGSNSNSSSRGQGSRGCFRHLSTKSSTSGWPVLG
jgi:hypothetical protein